MTLSHYGVLLLRFCSPSSYSSSFCVEENYSASHTRVHQNSPTHKWLWFSQDHDECGWWLSPRQWNDTAVPETKMSPQVRRWYEFQTDPKPQVQCASSQPLNFRKFCFRWKENFPESYVWFLNKRLVTKFGRKNALTCKSYRLKWWSFDVIFFFRKFKFFFDRV